MRSVQRRCNLCSMTERMWHVAQVLSDGLAMPERVIQLAVPVALEYVRQRLTNRRARRHRLSEHRLRVCDGGCAHGCPRRRCHEPSPLSCWSRLTSSVRTGQVRHAAVGIGGQASDGRLSRRLLLGRAARPFACNNASGPTE
jgi:hypothetical protein